MKKSTPKTKPKPKTKRGPGFQKGKSGNPNGRPKGTGRPTFQTLLANIEKNHKGLLDWQNPDHGIISDPLEQAVIQLDVAVQNGESWAIVEMLNRGLGKPHQAIEMEHTGNVTVRFDKEDQGL